MVPASPSAITSQVQATIRSPIAESGSELAPADSVRLPPGIGSSVSNSGTAVGSLLSVNESSTGM